MSLTIWTLSLELARICGWTPAGTTRQDPGKGTVADTLLGVRHLVNWLTEYRASDGQLVSVLDATQLADSFARAATSAEMLLKDWDNSQVKSVEIRTETPSFNWFTTPGGKQHLRNLANFCRGGAFQIC